MSQRARKRRRLRRRSELRAKCVAFVTARMAGSPEAAQHTHIECWCDDGEHRRDDYDQGCYCPECASEAAVDLGYPPTDIEPEAAGPDDSPQWCETCDRLITTEGITADGAEDELAHWENGLGEDRLNAPDEWRVFLLCVEGIPEKHLPRVAAVIARQRDRSLLPQGVGGPSPSGWRAE